jgi:hypothetical protein
MEGGRRRKRKSKKQQQIADKRWSSGLEVGYVLMASLVKERST